MKPFTITLVGETNVNRNKPETAFTDVMDFLQASDVLVGHMETLFSQSPSQDPDRPDIPYKPLWRFSTPENAQAWKTGRFDAVSLASNISYSDEALATTVETLDALQIAHAGIGKNLAAALTPAIVERNGVRVGLLSFTCVFWPFLVPASESKPGAATLPAQTLIEPHRRNAEMPGAMPTVHTSATVEARERLSQAVLDLKRRTDHVIVSVHWGVSGSEIPCDYQIELGHLAIDCGADAVMGHHPHTVQGIELYKGHPIFYSMGNFAFDWFHMKGRSQTGYGAQLTWNENNLTVALTLFGRDEHEQIQYLQPETPRWTALFETLKRLSLPFGTLLRCADGQIIVEGRCPE